MSIIVSIQPKPKKGLVAIRLSLPFYGCLDVSIQPKPKKGLVETLIYVVDIKGGVSIQPKPKKGLVVKLLSLQHLCPSCFNPAEAEEGFSRLYNRSYAYFNDEVSIQPKPKKGLVGCKS